jgi:hypothetical protein
VSSSWLCGFVRDIIEEGEFMKLSALVILLVSTSPANAEILSFSGVDGKSTIAQVQAKFPAAKQGKNAVCRPEEISRRFADGVSRCDYLTLESYKLGGYLFQVSFWFAESGGLKTVSLRWPKIAVNAEKPTDREIENAYWALVDVYVGKYGKYVTKPPCSYIVAARCKEWQINGSTDWHAGGERIEIEYETKVRTMSGVTIKYSFANRDAFDRF